MNNSKNHLLFINMPVNYEKLDHITHIHRRPDTYIGSLRLRSNASEWIASKELDKIVKEENVTYSDGLLRIFVEPLSNVIDNVWRSRQNKITVSKIKITIDQETGVTQVWNDGIHIPVELHEKEKIYIPELIFGHLMAGSNMDDEEARLSSGRNGLGVKLLNVFSTSFKIEIYDPEKGLLYTQVWKNNMRNREEPKIRSKKTGKTGYCQITWTPDFEKFHMQKYDETIMRLYAKYCMDAAMITKLPVFFNDKKFVFKTMSDYVSIYPIVSKDGNKDEKVFMEINPWSYDTPEYKTSIVIASSLNEESCEIGFVNGVYTSDGGVHTDAVMNELMSNLLPKFSKNGITAKDLKPHFMIFVNAWVPNPEFSTQSKTKLRSPPMPFKMETRYVNTILKWSFMDKIADVIKAKQLLTLRKTEKKTKAFKQIEGLDPANLAGTKHSKECTLILCEGLSAKTYATKGIASGWNSKKGRDYFGIYPLRGKLLNVRNATLKSISENKEISDVIQTIGLKHNTDYSEDDNFASLRYGRVLIITDADEDGHHICSLILNVFHSLFPSLFKRPDFFYLMMTPIAKIFHGSKVLDYYNDFEYQKALDQFNQQKSKVRVKYFKGLGTSTDDEIRSTFGHKVVGFVRDDQTDFYMNKLFHKNFANERKDWLTTYDPTAYKTPEDEYSVTNYFCQDLIKFSIGDCRRNIPCLFDGLKVSQRKILYSVFKKNLTHSAKSMKVAQLAGFCAETSNYHHGEQCLYDTITRMSQDYPGSNNVPYFTRDGQFGSRSYAGKDAASARYIFTKCTPLTRILYPTEDDPLLTYTLDDGDKVEPDFYIPILPTILINGCVAGIGTGWSSYIPCFGVEDIVSAVRGWIIDRDDQKVMDLELTPSYKGFTGTFKKVDSKKYECRGVIKPFESGGKKKSNGRMYEITDIPIGTATNKYKEDLEVMLENKKLRSLKNYSTPDTVRFVIEVADDFEPTHENMKLVSMISINNLVLFTENHKLQRFNTVGEILLIYMKKRLELYEKRKQRLIEMLLHEILVYSQKRKFIDEVDNGLIKVFKTPEEDLIRQLRERHYKPIDEYQHLLNIPVRDFTQTKVKALDDKIARFKKELNDLKKKEPYEIWTEELDHFMVEYGKI
jgi:DNA topoisomerase-2